MLQPLQIANTRKAPWALAAASLGAWSLAALCNELQIDFEVAVFNRSFPAASDDTERTFADRRHKAIGGLRRTHSGSADADTHGGSTDADTHTASKQRHSTNAEAERG